MVDTCPPPSLDVENPGSTYYCIYIYIHVYNKTRLAWEGLKFLTQFMGVSNHLGLSFAFLGVDEIEAFFCLPVQLHRKSIQNGRDPLRSNSASFWANIFNHIDMSRHM